MRKIKITAPTAAAGKHFEVGETVDLPDDHAAAIVQVEKGNYVDDGDPEVENRDPQPKKKKN